LARELYLQLLIVKDIQKYDVEVVFLSQKFGNNPADQLLFQMLGAISEFERAQILERTRRGKLRKARSGLIVGGKAPFGFTYIKKSEKDIGRYIVNEKEAESARQIFKIFNSGNIDGIRTLAKELHRLGIKNHSGSTVWAKSSLSKILKDESLIGITYWNKSFACESLKKPSGVKTYKRVKNTGRRLRPR